MKSAIEPLVTPDKVNAWHLTPKEKKFALNILAGMNQGEAYLAAGYRAKNMNTRDAGASIVLKRPHVQAYLESIRKSQWASEAMSHAEARFLNAKALRTGAGDVKPTDPACQAYEEIYDAKGNLRSKKVKMVDKVGVMKLDRQMAGDFNGNEQKQNPFQFLVAIQLNTAGNGQEKPVIEVSGNPRVEPQTINKNDL